MEKTLLEGERIFLRPLKLSDAIIIYKNLQDKEIHKWTTIPWPYKKEHAIKFIRKAKYGIKKSTRYIFGIVKKDSKKLVGVIDLFNIDWKNKNAEIGYWVAKKYWGQGIATEATKLMLKFAFNKLKLHRVYAKLFETNVASKRVLEKVGFKFEGIAREEIKKGKKWFNGLYYGILKKEHKNS